MDHLAVFAAYVPALKPDPWRWVPHPEVWVMVASLLVMYLYATRVIGPKVVPPGQPIITRSQSRWFFSGLVILWIVVDWPFHDLAEDYLYSIHMIQHLVLTMVVAPMMLLAMPEWLARLVLGRGRGYRVFRLVTRPLVAGLIFNAVFALSHLPAIVNDSIRWSSVHFTAHLVIIFSAIIMWNCVCGPLKELRASLPVQCIYLFLMGVLPIIPGSWLSYSQNVVYPVYIHNWRSFWGFTPLEDQQFAGFIMKAVGGMYLGFVIIVLFFKWARESTVNDESDLRERDRERIARYRAEHPESKPVSASGRTGPQASA